MIHHEIVAYNVGVVSVLLSARPPRLGGVELSEKGASLLPVLLGPERTTLYAPLQRRRSAGVAAVVLGQRWREVKIPVLSQKLLGNVINGTY